jgi:superfamily II DNA or RNA helicase
MQIPHALHAGDLVVVRRRRWRVVAVRSYDDCEAVTLCGVGRPDAGIERRVLAPFDTIEPIARTRAARHVGAARWRRACRALIASDTPPGGLRAAATARIDLFAYQLEPAMAVVRGMGARLLLADEVGLGKTIQAGLVWSELHARAVVERALVLAPAGLRDQWVQELADRFSIAATGVDGPMLRRLATTLPIGVNPWSTLAAAVASIDYVKRSEVLPAVAARPWDLILVDEAHGVAGDSDRQAAVQALTSQAAYVVMLTATPHNGDGRAFAALCDLGAVDAAPLLVFRRTRRELGIGTTRRVRALRLALGPDERRLHLLLAEYTSAVRAERQRRGDRAWWLALSVLHKRALSSPWSLGQSIGRRLSALTSAAPTDPPSEQLALPLGDLHGELVAADEPPPWPADLRLSDARRERHMLEALITTARRASRHGAKLRALGRLLRRANEPAVVFTEYRDTLMHVRDHIAVNDAVSRRIVLLHGGLTRVDRLAALAAFAATPRSILLATDAAAEGLNLHRTCRLVVNLELPWNPMRLEQRIGRVDRIGQRRTVHAVHLVASGTGETQILARLRSRLAVARAELGAPDPLGEDDDATVAALVIGGEDSRTDADREPEN